MTVDLTIQVLPDLAHRLQPFQERLAELLERGLHAIALEGGEAHQDEATIMEVLASNPSPEQVMALRPSLELQARVSALLEKSKGSVLSRQEEAELDRYLVLEHLVRLAKAYAAQRLEL